MTAKEADELLAVIAARAPALVAAGVRGRVELGDIAFILAGAEPDAPRSMPADPALEIRDPLDDPATHGQFGPDARRRQRYVRPPLVGDE